MSYITPTTTVIASAFRIKSYFIIPTAPASVANSVPTIKSYLAAGYPIYIGMVVDSSITRLTAANPVLNAYSGVGPGGHAMVISGYDDSVAGGSFRVMNSWGTRVADGGYFWLPYSFWTSGVKSPQAMVFTVNPADPAAYDV